MSKMTGECAMDQAKYTINEYFNYHIKNINEHSADRNTKLLAAAILSLASALDYKSAADNGYIEGQDIKATVERSED